MRLAALLLLLLRAAASGGDWFAGGMGGLSTLSADAQVEGSPPRRFSAYKPENGPAAMAFFGRDATRYFSVQISHAWNRNSVLLSNGDIASSSSSELPGRLTAHTTAVEGIVYFRAAGDRIRPYLSAGPGISRLSLEPGSAATHASFRVAVGIDLEIRNGLAFRYSFSETIQSNIISKALRPPAQRNLANFQNWFGLCWRFR